MTGVGRASAWLTLGLSVALVFAGCSDDSDEGSASEGVSDSGDAAGANAEEVTDAADAAAPDAQPLTVERRIVYTGHVEVEVDDVEDAAADAVAIAEEAGGFLFAQELDLEGDRDGRLTLKVPPESSEIDSIMTSIGELGDAVDSRLAADDVTADAVDLEGRVTSAQASVDRLTAMLGEAANTTDLVTIETELARRESELESLEGQLRVLNEQADMATIEVVLVEDDDDGLGFVDAIGSGARVLLAVVWAGVIVVGFLLPFALVIVAIGAFRRFRRGRRGAVPPVPPVS